MKIPTLLVGAVGAGKTATVESQYDHTEKLLTSSMVEEDIAGLVYREGEDEKRTVPAFVRRIQKAVKEGKRTCLFLDEVDKGRREVVDTLLTLITHQESYGIPKEVDIVLACNPPEWGGGDGVSIPLLNRVAIIPFVPDIAQWATWLRSQYPKNEFVELVAERVEMGEIPLLETTGEHLERRVTSPRSLHMAISAWIHYPENEAKQMSDGLLTPNAASSMYFTWKRSQEKRGEQEGQRMEETNTKATRIAGKHIIFKTI